MAFELKDTAWVDADGSYGIGEIILFDQDDITQKQWERLSNMRDNSKFDYIAAIMHGEDLSEWEEEEEEEDEE